MEDDILKRLLAQQRDIRHLSKRVDALEKELASLTLNQPWNNPDNNPPPYSPVVFV